MGKSVGRKIGLAGIVIFVILMLLLSGLCWWLWHCRSTGSAPRVLGYELMSLHGEEMEPEFPDGSLVFLTKVQPQSLKSGDVVVYGRENGQGGTLTRIVNLAEKDGISSVLLKEDRLSESYELSRGEIGYRAAGSMPYLGTVWDFLLTRKGLLCVIVIPCGVFFFIELIQLIVYACTGRRQEESGGLQKKLASHTADDQRENFVDVTADYTGRGPARLYRSPLRREMAEESSFRSSRFSGEPEEDVSKDSLSDKYSALDFNPIQERHSFGVEQVIIPDGPADAHPSVLRLTIDGKETAELPLSGSKEVSVKVNGYRIDITVAPEQ